jgi:peptide/nickel transport system permease protein
MTEQSKPNVIQTTPSSDAVVAKLEDKPSGFHLPYWFVKMLRAVWPFIALLTLVFFTLMGIFGPVVAPKDPNRQNLILRLMEPLQANEEGVVEFPLGTDALGRDVLSRLLHGARISLWVGLAAVIVGGLTGTILGLISGYLGGFTDDVIMRLADIQLAFPFILLAIMVLVVLGSGVLNLILVLGIGQWVIYARIARGETISQREKEYVEAARSGGMGQMGIMFKHILPNILAPIIVIATFNVASVILAEASLSFLGLGVPPDIPTWGAMLAESREQLLGGKWWLAFYPGLAIMLVVLALNILGDWMRDFLDPRLRGR